MKNYFDSDDSDDDKTPPNEKEKPKLKRYDSLTSYIAQQYKNQEKENEEEKNDFIFLQNSTPPPKPKPTFNINFGTIPLDQNKDHDDPSKKHKLDDHLNNQNNQAKKTKIDEENIIEEKK